MPSQRPVSQRTFISKSKVFGQVTNALLPLLISGLDVCGALHVAYHHKFCIYTNSNVIVIHAEFCGETVFNSKLQKTKILFKICGAFVKQASGIPRATIATAPAVSSKYQGFATKLWYLSYMRDITVLQ